MRNIESPLKATTIAIVAILASGCSDSDGGADNTARTATVGFSVDREISPMSDNPKAEKYLQSCGYQLKANGEVVYSDVCLGGTYEVEIRDGYKLTVEHPSLGAALASGLAEDWTVEGDHTVAIGESSFTIRTHNEHFSFVTVEESPYILWAHLSDTPMISSEDASYRYGFVTGERYYFELESQMGHYQDNSDADVSMHYHYFLSDGDATIGGPDRDWGDKNISIGGDAPIGAEVAMINVSSYSEQEEGVWVVSTGSEESQPRVTPYPAIGFVAAAGDVNVVEEISTGWVNYYTRVALTGEDCRLTRLADGRVSGLCFEGYANSVEEAFQAYDLEFRDDYLEAGLGRSNLIWRITDGSAGLFDGEAQITLAPQQ
ncbi:hypothetical protein [Ferrimonas marina]|uniref:Uncharacterized protein n=1 Tax=Ferrimonas marina TaxID=299255 RepID=A0A1M5Z525_9GAMM|nr:hypothetical protein [Ferrimonas marina]SHI19319.1 hypothetical protein SAMN02745129_4658 [Ferrimonas marina]